MSTSRARVPAPAAASPFTAHHAPPDDTALRWLWELTAIPTAAGREWRVSDWIERWVADRPDLRLQRDSAGNLIVERAHAASGPALFFTAHMDHPAFVVERIVAPAALSMSFRGGVMEPYFTNARVSVFAASGEQLGGTLLEKTQGARFPEYLVELDDADGADRLAIGDVARWELPEPSLEGDLFHTHACDDLAAAAAALAAMDQLRASPDAAHVKLLFTRAEEIGFVGAIAACKLHTMPADSRVVALENSRSFPSDSPIGGGPIVRVGDRLSTFHPGLTAAVGKVAEDLAGLTSRNPGEPAKPGEAAAPAGYRWQRKLMPGGACEASAFQSYGYQATCVCLPLGNYHNMANLQAVQDGDAAAIAGAAPGREFISVGDYLNLVRLLVACGTKLSQAPGLVERFERMYGEKSFVLG